MKMKMKQFQFVEKLLLIMENGIWNINLHVKLETRDNI